MKTQKHNSQQKKKDVGTLSNSLSGGTKQGRDLISQDDTKLQIERSASSLVDNQSADNSPQSTGDDTGLSQDMKQTEGIYKSGVSYKPETPEDNSHENKLEASLDVKKSCSLSKEITTQQTQTGSHDFHSQLNEIETGCGDGVEYDENGFTISNCGDVSSTNKVFLCTKCQSKRTGFLLGCLLGVDSEIEFLEKINYKDNDSSFKDSLIQERLQQLTELKKEIEEKMK